MQSSSSIAPFGRPVRLIAGAAFFVVAFRATPAGAQQSDFTIGPFLTYLPSAGASPLAGVALTLGGGPLVLRGGGHVSLDGRSQFAPQSGMVRPWGADADALLFIGGSQFGARRTLAPFVFAGLGVQASDSDATVVNHSGWSYGAGLSVPLAGSIDITGETRYRMSRFLLPGARGAPTPRQEFRVGLSFHFSGGSRHGYSRSVEARQPTALGSRATFRWEPPATPVATCVDVASLETARR
jgi:hypothetical protein